MVQRYSPIDIAGNGGNDTAVTFRINCIWYIRRLGSSRTSNNCPSRNWLSM